MQTIERAPSGHAGGSRSCAYADIVYTVATSADTSLDIVGQTHQALAALSISLKGLGSHVSRMLSAQVLLADMAYIHATGVVDDLKSYLEKCRSREFIYHTLNHQIDKVTRVGDLAIALGEMVTIVTSGGIRKHLHNRTLTAWQKTGEQWQLLVYQATPLKPAVVLETS